MKAASDKAEQSLEVKMLVFQMHANGCTQDMIAAYLGKSKGTINAMLKPLQKEKEKK